MSDREFVPFTPRRLERSHGVAVAAADRAPSEDAVPEADHALENDAPQCDALDNAAHREADASLAPLGAASDASRIRAAAIELAAAACARALRYAVDRNPRLLARFVDEALRAAGSPQNAAVRVAPSCAPAGDYCLAHDFVSDPTLGAGDVFVDCSDGTLGATLEERAERLVRSAAT
ncbi:MAG TPA: hypothetical protein VJN22_07380 [Candidatus Eremiobacteraceae bacterium]|nr:hypothetical protein [Candidatus Eremiobacteraceae bacterium]